MKIILLCLFLCISLNSKASWNSLSEGEVYFNKGDISLTTQNGKLNLKRNQEVFFLTRVIDLSRLKVTLYEFQLQSCDDAKLQSDMELLLYENTEFGIQLSKDCKIEVFIENYDLGHPSFFEEL